MKAETTLEMTPTEIIVLPTGKKVEINTGLFINNEFVESVDGKRFETINPSTGKVITTVAEATPNDIDIAVNAAENAFEKVWKQVSSSERGRLLYKLIELIRRDFEILAAIESLDNGKSFEIAQMADLPVVIQTFEYFAGFAEKINGEVIDSSDDKFLYTRREPIGIVGGIIPFNFPLCMLSWKVAPALITGNVIVLKPAEQTPLSALYLAKLIREAGFPPGVVNICPGWAEAGKAIASHMKIGKVAFTGSTAVGRSILRAASSSNMKKVTLELGGKSPTIICAGADLEEAVKWAHMGIFFNSGQCCTAGSRVYVEESIYEEFLEKFKEHAASTKIGDPFDQGTYQGPLISQEQFDRVMEYIEAGKNEGATLEMGGERHGNQGFFIKPTVFTNVNESMKIMQEEIFGPVVAVDKFKTIDEALERAHMTNYGLAAAVFTKDISKAISVANKLKAGTVWVNCYNLVHASAPFGGYKESGHGRENGKSVLDSYTEVKTVCVNLNLPI
ncbi:3468_t:CDS:2 [Paraglomus occultum]|uniref:3468_t:CDS:1 n=1 Tax=Paraglomus occultum TaxID=144539 RepID=A0A9N8ZR50_9GLOM|nr:3468_t:CDS:2 [Paraglomus occultum]